MMPLANNDQRDCGFDLQFCTRGYVDIRRRTRHGGGGGKHTTNEGELLLQNSSELSFGDAI